MKPCLAFCTATLLGSQLVQPAGAASSAWHHVDGADIRLVTSSAGGTTGTLRGALEIVLEPGWKTYWRDPGDAGVPPSIGVDDSANVESAQIGFPVPRRFDDGYATWAGYNEPVALAVDFSIPEPGAPALIEADVFLGICQEICIPVQARLSVDPSTPDTADETALVADAHAALPATERPDFRAEIVERSQTGLLVEAHAPQGDEIRDLFVAGGDSYAAGTPVRAERDGRTLFSVEITRWSEGALAPAFYTLATKNGAVSGFLTPGD